MNRPLWVQKLSNEQLEEMLGFIQDIEVSGGTHEEKVWRYADTWYSNQVGIERLLALSIDVYKEAAFRWMKEPEAKWIEEGNLLPRCSNCGEYSDDALNRCGNFCHNCGRRMSNARPKYF